MDSTQQIRTSAFGFIRFTSDTDGKEITIYSPVDQSILGRYEPLDEAQALAVLSRSKHAFHHSWRRVPLIDRIRFCNKFLDVILAKKLELAKELTMVVGR